MKTKFESAFDKIANYSLRIELVNGKVLIYRIDAENKQYLINRLHKNSIGEESNKPLKFIWFETCLDRSVIINSNALARITFCYDVDTTNDASNYVDNFDAVYNDTETMDIEPAEENIPKDEDLFLPQAIVYHKGLSPEDNYDKNPLTYDSLEKDCLSDFDLELDGESPFRQFINLIDDDGEETFIPLEQIITMEFDTNLMHPDENIDEIQKESSEDRDYTLLN